jgi:hypothetical protein
LLGFRRELVHVERIYSSFIGVIYENSSQKMALFTSFGVVGLGILLRVCGFSMGLHEFMSWRPEFVTPLTSFNRRESK